jgi:hypothetical protein
MKKNRWAEKLGQGDTEGHCVFTNTRILGLGDPNSYNFSYFFFANKETTTSEQINEQVQNLFANHRSVTDKVNGVDYDQVDYMIKHAHPEYGIPVFALMMQGKIHSLGFANMPRVSYKHSNHDLIEHHSKEHMDDAYFSLSELMLGTLRDEGLGLKSRVHFSDAVLSNQETTMVSKPVVLGSPKPSFLGAYIEQPEVEQYQSYGYHNDKETAKVAGWKRYPVMQEFKENEPPNDNENVQTKLELLTENHTFQGRIAFHNLKREELAALVWVLSLNGSDDYYHSLGHGKPLGAGAVQFELSLKHEYLRANEGELDGLTVETLSQEFVQHMDEQMKQGQWLETPQVQHLLALSDSQISGENEFFYPELKSFQKIKNARASIEPLSYRSKLLSRTERAPEKMGSLSFGKGRLAALFNSDSNHHQELQKLALDKVTVMEKKHQKAKQAEKAQQLADASPFDRALGELTLIVEGQASFNKTEQDKAAKQMREALKVFKTLAESGEFDEAKLQQVKNEATQITIKPNDAGKLTKWLNKQ